MSKNLKRQFAAGQKREELEKKVDSFCESLLVEGSVKESTTTYEQELKVAWERLNPDTLYPSVAVEAILSSFDVKVEKEELIKDISVEDNKNSFDAETAFQEKLEKIANALIVIFNNIKPIDPLYEGSIKEAFRSINTRGRQVEMKEVVKELKENGLTIDAQMESQLMKIKLTE